MKAAADGRIELSERFKDHLYLCLLCRACETACPSGVQYGRIAETARESDRSAGIEACSHRFKLRLYPTTPYPRRLTLAAALLRLYQRSGLQRAIRPLLPERLRRMESMLPPISPRFFAPDANILPAIGERRAKVAMLNGCVMPLLFGDVNEATVRVLRRNGCDVVFSQKSNLLRCAQPSQRRKRGGETDGAAQHRCLSRRRCRCRRCQRRRLRCRHERVRPSTARRSDLRGESETIQLYASRTPRNFSAISALWVNSPP